jgi:hypothetical protein
LWLERFIVIWKQQETSGQKPEAISYNFKPDSYRVETLNIKLLDGNKWTVKKGT